MMYLLLMTAFSLSCPKLVNIIPIVPFINDISVRLYHNDDSGTSAAFFPIVTTSKFWKMCRKQV